MPKKTLAMQIRCRYDKLIPVSELQAMKFPNNPNKHSTEQITRLAQIMHYQGIRHPIVVSNLSSLITKGHGRLEAALTNGWTEFPIEFQDYEDRDQEYADIVADNAIARYAELDLKAINLEIPDLGPDLDIDLLGIKDFKIEPMDKYEEGELKDKPPMTCPECGHVFGQRGKADNL